MNIQNSQSRDYAHGAIIGALVGDAAGATLEFHGAPPTNQEVRQALKMVGGGVWGTAPGQITDDGEMTLVLCRSLIGECDYDSKRVAHGYRRWYLSEPFDIGATTSNALREGDLSHPYLEQIMRSNALNHNQESKANGCLMRVSPLGVWGATVEFEVAIAAALSDAGLTHPNASCQWATAAYVIAIRHLILNPGDNIGAFEAASQVVSCSDAAEVRSWLSNAKRGILPVCAIRAGFIGIAFTHAFYHLYNATAYVQGLTEILREGGDTDTNACITGGLLGALWGVNEIPESMRLAVLNCDVAIGELRPVWLQTKGVEKLIDGLLSKIVL